MAYEKGSVERAIDNELNRLNKQLEKFAKAGGMNSTIVQEIYSKGFDLVKQYDKEKLTIVNGESLFTTKVVNGVEIRIFSRSSKVIKGILNTKSKRAVEKRIAETKKINSFSEFKLTPVTFMTDTDYRSFLEKVIKYHRLNADDGDTAEENAIDIIGDYDTEMSRLANNQFTEIDNLHLQDKETGDVVLKSDVNNIILNNKKDKNNKNKGAWY